MTTHVRVTEEQEALTAAARLLSGIMDAGTRASLADEVTERLPWTRFLPEEDRRAFVSEFLQQFEACADLGDFGALGTLLGAWKNTAGLHAEGLAPALRKPVRVVGARVPRPGR